MGGGGGGRGASKAKGGGPMLNAILPTETVTEQ